MKIKYFAFFITAVFILAGLIGCSKNAESPAPPVDNPVTPTGQAGMTTAQKIVNLIINQTLNNDISGGIRPYTIKSNSDTSVAIASIGNSTTSTQYMALSITSKKVGKTTVTVADSGSVNTCVIEVNVGTFIISPNPATVTKGANATLTVAGGKSAYTIKTQPDSTIATTTMSSATQIKLNGVKAGTTQFVLQDSDSPASEVTVPVTVVDEFRPNDATLTVTMLETKSTTITGGIAPYQIVGSPTASIATATLSGAILNITGIKKGNTEISLADASNPTQFYRGLMIYIESNVLTAPVDTILASMLVTTTLSISDGKLPYTIESTPNSSIATASLSTSTLSVTGVSVGTTKITVKDASSTPKRITLPIKVSAYSGPLIASDTVFRLNIDLYKRAAISGGTRPFTIMTMPNAAVAYAKMSGDTVIVNGIGFGTSQVVLKDASVPAKTLTLNISCTSFSQFLKASVNPIVLDPNQTKTSEITTGITPYWITVPPVDSIALATFLTGTTTMQIAAKKPGVTSVTIRDGSDPVRTLTIPITVKGPLTVTPNPIYLSVGGNKSAVVSGGTPPYAVVSNPSNIAMATLSAGNLYINSFTSAGSTSMVIRDSSNPNQTVTVSIIIQ